MNREKVERKISALRRFTVENGCTAEEVDNAKRKIFQLVRKYIEADEGRKTAFTNFMRSYVEAQNRLGLNIDTRV